MVLGSFEILPKFRANVALVHDLLDFDRFIVDFAIDGMRAALSPIREDFRLRRAGQVIENRLPALETIRENDSLRPKYEAMINQSVVLLVSYFGSTVHSLFIDAVALALGRNSDVPVTGEDVKLSWRDFSGGFGPSIVFAEALIAQKDISFQDMQSISRAFSKYLLVQIDRSPDVNDIILGQAARHSLVHASGMVDAKMLKQVSQAVPRKLKPQLVLDESLRFAPDEVRELSEAMVRYVELVAESVERTL